MQKGLINFQSAVMKPLKSSHLTVAGLKAVSAVPQSLPACWLPALGYVALERAGFVDVRSRTL